MSVAAPPRPPHREPPDPEALIAEARRRTRRRRARYAGAAVAAAAVVCSLVWLAGVHGWAQRTGGPPGGLGAPGGSRPSYGLVLEPPSGEPRTVRFVRLRPGTVEPVGPSVDLRSLVRDWAAAPDGGSIAFGGPRIVLLDLRRMRRAGAIRIPGALQVDIEAWPTQRHLVAFAYTRAKGGNPLLGEVLEIDPVSRRVAVRGRFEGFAVGETAWGPGGWPIATLLEPHGGIGPARLLLVHHDGSIRAVVLSRIASNMFTTFPGLAVGAQRVVVAGTGTLLAEVDLRTLAVRYHRVPGLRRLILSAPGTRYPVVIVQRSVELRPGGRIELGDERAHPSHRPTFTGIDMQTFRPVLVDPQTWRIAGVVTPSGGTALRRRVGGVLPEDTDELRAYDLGGTHLLWSKNRPGWSAFGDVLIAARDPDSGVSAHPFWYVDPRTGAWIRPLTPAEEAVRSLCDQFASPAPPDRRRDRPLVCGL